ncbi:MAG: ABC transporter ATP-binding protein [Selenomonadaceae bacterium]|nr:ABC transporter ATP-binding protein [Selenomonadaceae bacterium]
MNDYVIEADNLATGYPGHPVMEGLSFGVRPGELVGIIGPNGAGKSTLLKTLRGIIPPLKGSVRLMGRPITEQKEKEIALSAAYLQQQVNISFGYSVREIVMTGRYPYLKWWEKESDRDEAIVDACLAYTGVADLAEKSLTEISGGQRQRVLLAKVLAQQSPVMFLDEPATGLDIFYQEEIYRFARDLCRGGKTILMVVHEMNLAARFCSRLLMLGQSRLVADGPVSDVLREDILTAAFGTPIRVSINQQTGHHEVYSAAPENDSRRAALLSIILGKEGTA